MGIYMVAASPQPLGHELSRPSFAQLRHEAHEHELDDPIRDMFVAVLIPEQIQ